MNNQETRPEKTDLTPIDLGEKIGEGNASEIWTLKSNPEKVVRIFSPHLFQTNEILKRCRKGKELINELRGKYKVNIPPIETAIGTSLGGTYKRTYTLTDRIRGKNLKELSEREFAEIKDELEDLLVSLVSYFDDKYVNRGDFLADIDQRQFMYGKRAEDANRKLYLVDTDPFYVELQEDLEAHWERELVRRVYRLGGVIRIFEDWGNFNLAKAKKAIIDLEKKLPKIDFDEDEQ